MANKSSAALHALHDAGVQLIPIVRGEKRPAIDDWRNFHAKPDDIDRWLQEGRSVGAIAKKHPFIDIDVTTSSVVELVRNGLYAALGVVSTYRIGRAPKCAVMCQTRDPFGKITLPLVRRNGGPLLNDNGKPAQIEILADGQQALIYGPHPDTRRPYSYERGGQTGGVEMLVESVRAGLPQISAGWVHATLFPALQRALAPINLNIEVSGTSAPRKTDVDQASLRAPSIDMLRDVVAQIPNVVDDRKDYIKMLAAIRAAAGDDVDAGVAIALEWSSRWEGGTNEPNVVERDYRTLNPPHEVGWNWITDQARGFYDASKVAPLGTESERIAALHGTAERALLLELPTLEDGALPSRVAELEAAATTVDPLRPAFTNVLKEAHGLRAYAADEHVFDAMLRARLPLPSGDDARLLRRAAWALVAPKDALGDQLAVSPGSLATPSTVARDWVLDGLLAAGWVGALVGESSGGKTFIATNLAAAIGGDDGVSFGGHAVQRGSVLYCPSEDRDGVRERLQRYGDRRVYVAERTVPLRSALDAIAFTRTALAQIPDRDAHPLRLIVIDTLSGALGVGNENDVQVMAPALRAAKLVARITGAAVLILHHTGHGNSERGRGSSAFNAELDVGFLVKKSDNNITLLNNRLKSGPQGEILRFHIKKPGVVCAGSAEGLADDGEPDSHHVVRALREISLNGAGVTKSDIAAALAESCPNRFGAAIARTTLRDRLNRALGDAFRREWIAHRRGRGGDRLVLAVDPPEVLRMPVGNLDAVLGGVR